jgi:hypothetical protein
MCREAAWWRPTFRCIRVEILINSGQLGHGITVPDRFSGRSQRASSPLYMLTFVHSSVHFYDCFIEPCGPLPIDVVVYHTPRRQRTFPTEHSVSYRCKGRLCRTRIKLIRLFDRAVNLYIRTVCNGMLMPMQG